MGLMQEVESAESRDGTFSRASGMESPLRITEADCYWPVRLDSYVYSHRYVSNPIALRTKWETRRREFLGREDPGWL